MYAINNKIIHTQFTYTAVFFNIKQLVKNIYPDLVIFQSYAQLIYFNLLTNLLLCH